MNSDFAGGEHLELLGELRRRFPLLEQLVGRFGEDTQEERIPWFFALLLSAAMECVPGACCFVLDKTRATTATTAIVLAFIKLQNKFPALVKNYAKTALHRGQRVKVKPSDFVYEYDGPWEEFPERFRLKVLGQDSSRRSFPMAEVLRLEPSDRMRPKGRLDSVLGAFERSCLDELLDLTTCGNNSLIQNNVLLYMAQAQFAEVVGKIALATENATGFDYLSDFLPWGSIGPDGDLRPNDVYQVTGEPIIAVTRVPEDLALASSSAPVATKVVLVDGARGLARNLQAFDDIADRQRMVILASWDETEALDQLKHRDCPIWYMSPDEIMIGEASTGNRARASLVGATIRAADTRQRVKVTVVNCQDSVLQGVAESLERAAAMIEDGEEGHESDEILARLFGILFEFSECCFGVGEETKDNLQAAQEKIIQYGRWLAPEVVGMLREASFRLEGLITTRSYHQDKADALVDIILDGQHKLWAVAARSPRTAESLRTGLSDLGVAVPVIPVSSIRPNSDFGGIIVPAWPNEQRFTRLKALAVTPDIRVLAYPFEAKWVSRHRTRERARERSNRMEMKKRASILGIDARFLTSLKRDEQDLPSSEDRPVPPIFRIEDRVAKRRIKRPAAAVDGEDSREAQLVEFIGGCYALVTEYAELHTLNHLIDKANTTEATLRTVTTSQLSPGDFLLFRASGGKEFIRLIAEDILGREEYEKVRAVAERWRSSLRRLGTSPTEVQRRLEAHGLIRTTVTVGGWLGNPDRIGPRDFGDIKFIAKATGDANLLSSRKQIEEAISCIRGTHISAGNQLTQLLLSELSDQMCYLDDQPVLLDLGYGKAWVVQVDVIETTRQKYLLNLVNRLLWVDETGF